MNTITNDIATCTKDLFVKPPTTETANVSSDEVAARPIERVELPNGILIIPEIDTRDPWFLRALASLKGFANLREDWDSYGAPRIDPRAIAHTLNLLQLVMTSEVPDPILVPTSTGGIQAEWHRRQGNLDIEIEVSASEVFECYITSDNEEFEGLLGLNACADRLKGIVINL